MNLIRRPGQQFQSYWELSCQRAGRIFLAFGLRRGFSPHTENVESLFLLIEALASGRDLHLSQRKNWEPIGVANAFSGLVNNVFYWLIQVSRSIGDIQTARAEGDGGHRVKLVKFVRSTHRCTVL